MSTPSAPYLQIDPVDPLSSWSHLCTHQLVPEKLIPLVVTSSIQGRVVLMVKEADVLQATPRFQERVVCVLVYERTSNVMNMISRRNQFSLVNTVH